MKALSLIQPWASLIAIGAKRWETRSWRTKYRGTIAIHASQNIRETYRLAEREPFKTALSSLAEDLGFGPELSLPKGAIIAVAELAEIIAAGEWVSHHRTEPEWSFGDYSPGRFAWRLAKIRALKRPVECNGSLSVWNVPPEVAEEVERNL